MINKKKLISEISRVMSLGNDIPGIEQCVKLLDEYTLDIVTRLRADFENEKKREKKNQKIVHDQIKFNTLSELTEVIDDFQFFEDVVTDSRSEYVKTGYALLKMKLDRFLSESEIESINTTIPFDPDLHECVSVMDGKKERGTILKVASRGYRIGDRIIKYPKVIVQS